MGVRIKRWTRDEYERLVVAGHFHPEARLQLIRGEIVEMTPQSAAHATAVDAVLHALLGIFREGHQVRAQFPLALSDDSEPEPDLAVVRGHRGDYSRSHPSSALLVVEVADTTLAFDRGPKLAMYALAGIPEYWILNLPDRALEVYREPTGDRYRVTRRLGPQETVAPVAAPDVRLQVADLLP
ncbi:MAG: Uma2 family endonuclease [Armatimonadota bacterium]|nr:Uma2 family endonuclease [Armatimonadota bacterium]MDR7548529.1 Uma2 family endonuclease [Armatimonadota bacterium]